MITDEESQGVHPTDQELLKQFADTRNEQAFVTLLRRYELLVRAVCRRVMRDEHLAEDAFQAVFLILAGQAQKLSQGARSLAPWLQTVATNAALQLRRSRVRNEQRELASRPVTSQSPLAELVGMLDEELQQLDAESREAIVLCHLHGLTQDEAAETLAISKSTLRRRLEQGITLLRSRFARRGLLLPLIAVLWNALSTETTAATPPGAVQHLADSAIQVFKRVPRPSGTQSLTSWNLAHRMLAMSHGSRMGRWAAVTLGVGAVAIGLSNWPLMGQSEAGEKPPVASGPAQIDAQAVAEAEAILKGEKPLPDLFQTPGQLNLNPLLETVQPKNKAAAKPVPKAAAKNKPKTQAQKPNAKKPNAKQPVAPLGNIPGLPGFPQLNVDGNAAFNGVLNINGQEFQTTDPAEFERMMRQNQNLFQGLPGVGNSAQAFQGVINNNGNIQKFDDQKAFEDAAKGLNVPKIK